MKNKEKKILAFQTTENIRKFEIELFWKRSLFFWGFIASAFAAYSALPQDKILLKMIIVNFGLICSLCWTLVNRGSKFWQENWETHKRKYVPLVTDKELNNVYPIQKKGVWSAKKYSPSKVTIALSDFVLIMWLCILIFELLKFYNSNSEIIIQNISIVFTIFTIIYSILILKEANTNEKR
jgi:hypothetical protein